MATDTLGSFEPVGSERHEPTEEEIMIQLNKLVDLKSIMQLPRFGIQNEDFPEWKHTFLNLLTPLNVDRQMEMTVSMDHEVTLRELDVRNTAIARFLYMMLDVCTADSYKAAVEVRSVKEKNGYVAWRRLVRSYQPETVDRWTAVRLGLL